MNNKSIIFKLWLSVILIMGITIIAFGTFIGKYFEDWYYATEADYLFSKANQIAEVVVFRDNKTLASEIIWELSRGINASVVIDTRWEMIGAVASGPRLDEIPNEIRFSDADIEKVFNGTSISKIGVIESNNTEIIAVIVPMINQQREIFGTVTMYKPTVEIEQRLNQTRILLVYSFTIAFLLSLIMALYLIKRVSDPLLEMNNVAKAMAEGNFNEHIKVKSDDEIGKLGRTLNLMAIELDRSINSLNKEKNQLNRILSSMSDSVISINNKQEIIMANPQANKMLKNWINQYRNDLCYNINRLPEELYNVILKAFEKTTKSYEEICIDGSTFTVAIDLLYEKENLIGIVAVMRDVTEDRRMDKLRKDFLANVSHELRTPLAMLQGYSEALIDGVVGDESAKQELYHIINDESIRMKRLVNDLLDLAKLEARQITLEKDTVNIINMLEMLVKKYSKLHNNKYFKLVNKLEELYVYIDPMRIEQVFINLIDNAVRHTPGDGEIMIEVTISDKVLISISDNGTGIKDEDLPFVFDRFYKADKARTRSRSGTGLGLAISKNIIEAHNGEITVKSKFGIGTTFTIELPTLKG